MFSRPKLPRTVPLETPDNSSDSSDSENEEGKEIQVNFFLWILFKLNVLRGLVNIHAYTGNSVSLFSLINKKNIDVWMNDKERLIVLVLRFLSLLVELWKTGPKYFLLFLNSLFYFFLLGRIRSQNSWRRGLSRCQKITAAIIFKIKVINFPSLMFNLLKILLINEKLRIVYTHILNHGRNTILYVHCLRSSDPFYIVTY